MILRRALVGIGWCAIALGPLFGFLGLQSTFRFTITADEPLELAVIWSAVAGVLPPVLFLVGFGAAMLMLASIDRRLALIEEKA